MSNIHVYNIEKRESRRKDKIFLSEKDKKILIKNIIQSNYKKYNLKQYKLFKFDFKLKFSAKSHKSDSCHKEFFSFSTTQTDNKTKRLAATLNSILEAKTDKRGSFSLVAL